jgi:putative transposase
VKTKLNKTIIIEDLNVSGMLKNYKLAKAISNIGFYEFRRQLEYKCTWYSKELIVADRFYASSKLCSCCGNKKEDLTLKDRIYCCDICDNEIDRDLNAAINLEKYTVRYTGINAGGDDKVHAEKLAGDRLRSQNQTKRSTFRSL